MRETRRQQRNGTVISNKMEKTVVVQVETLKAHPRYKKQVRYRKRYKVHDEKGECGLGDKVLIMETRPISKEKCWRVVQIVEKGRVATGEVVEPEEIYRRRKQRREEANKLEDERKAAEESGAEPAQEMAKTEEKSGEGTVEAEQEAAKEAPEADKQDGE